MKKSKKVKVKVTPSKNNTVVSKVFENGHFLELVYAPRLEKTAFAFWDGKSFEVRDQFVSTPEKTFVPVKPTNNLIRHSVIKFPSYVEQYESEKELIREIKSFIHKYVDLEPDFETIAAHYILLTWVYDRFRELPYLRLMGNYGTGKTRFLLIVGSLCYKPIFGSGASTTSPIFHSLDSFRGTLILDEADFRFSDAKAEITKILNNGNVKGFPVLRCEASQSGAYSPKAFHVFGPKIVATRGHYSDPALESRFIYERTKAGHIRKDIPVNLPDSYEQEAESLRNKLLMFRFKNWHRINPDKTAAMTIKSARIAQVYKPLFALATDPEAIEAIKRYAKKSERLLASLHSHSSEEKVLAIVTEILAKSKPVLSVANITQHYSARYGAEHIKPITPKWIGGVLRNKLHLNTIKRNGVYVLDDADLPKLTSLFERYNINSFSTVSDGS